MGRTVDVLMTNASAMTVGTVNFVIQNCAIHGATNTGNARMEHVYASLGGMESTAHSKVALEGKRIHFF